MASTSFLKFLSTDVLWDYCFPRVPKHCFHVLNICVLLRVGVGIWQTLKPELQRYALSGQEKYIALSLNQGRCCEALEILAFKCERWASPFGRADGADLKPGQRGGLGGEIAVAGGLPRDPALFGEGEGDRF